MAKLKTPYKDLLPPLTTDERAALKADIKENGVLNDVLIDENENVLDGHNRYEIDNYAPTRVIAGLTDEEKEAFVFRSNFNRRNLSPDQKREVTRKMKETAKRLRESDARKYTQKKIAELLGVARETVRNWFSTNGQEAKGSKPNAKVKIAPEKKPEIAKRVADGESQSQVAADFGVSQKAVSNVVRSVAKEEEKTREREVAAKKIRTNCGVLHGDFRVGGLGIEDESVGFIFTDPPYDKDATELLPEMLTFAARVLIPGGWIVSYSGQAHLPEFYAAVAATEGLEYAWTFACLHSGGDLRFRKYRIHNGWKPLIAAYRPPLSASWDWFKDVVSGGKEKDDHEWQQSESEAAYFIEKLAPAGCIVCDPFCGSGTTLAAAKSLDRKWIGFEQNSDHVLTARVRLDDEA